MAKFCSKCGSPLNGGAFCTVCGTDMRQGQAPVQSQPTQSSSPQPPLSRPSVVQAQPPTPSAPATTPAPPAAAGSAKTSPWVKLAIAAVALIFVVGAMAAGGVYYVVYRVKQKVHEVARDVSGPGSSPDKSSSSGGIMGSISKMVSGNSGSSSGSSSNGGISGDGCSLLSKEEVSRAVGVEIVATEPSENGCNYLAKGTQADMTAKHVTAMAKDKGADAQTQKMVQTFAGTLFNSFQEQHPNEHADQNGEVPVFVFSIDNQSAEAQMRLNAKVLGRLGPGPQGLPGIGDQAFDMGNAMIMVRKGDKLIRIMYTTCPCNTDAIKPLAKMLADRV